MYGRSIRALWYENGWHGDFYVRRCMLFIWSWHMSIQGGTVGLQNMWAEIWPIRNLYGCYWEDVVEYLCMFRRTRYHLLDFRRVHEFEKYNLKVLHTGMKAHKSEKRLKFDFWTRNANRNNEKGRKCCELSNGTCFTVLAHIRHIFYWNFPKSLNMQ